MHLLDRRKSVVFGMSAVAAVLALSSVAYACVQSRGEIFVTGDNGGVSTGVGNGHHPGAGPGNYIYCKPGKYLTTGAKSFADTATQNRGHFSVLLGVPPTDCQFLQKNLKSPWITNTTTPNVFVDGTYEVYFCQGQDGQPAFVGGASPTMLPTKGSCFFSDGVTDWGTLVGSVTVAGNVAPSSTFRVPFGAMPTPAGTYAGVSVRRTGPGGCGCGPPPVNMAPIEMI